MIAPLPALLEQIEPELPPELVGAPQRRALRARARGVPGAWHSGAIECRLTWAPAPCDFMVYATRGDGGQRALDAVLRSRRAKAFGRAQPYLREWTRRGSKLSREAAAVWVEYDVPRRGPAPDPFVFVCLYSDYLRDGYPAHQPRGAQSPRRVRALAAAGLRWASGRRPGERQLQLIARCAAALPPTGRLLHVVAIPHRLEGVRVGAILPFGDVERWLGAIGWTGTRAQVRELFELFPGTYDYLHVQVELSEQVEPKLAFDFNLSATPARSRHWSEFAAGLASSVCCDREKLSAALRWVRSRRVQLTGDDIPVRIDQQLFFKVSSLPDSIEAKAYLCFHPHYALL